MKQPAQASAVHDGRAAHGVGRARPARDGWGVFFKLFGDLPKSH